VKISEISRYKTYNLKPIKFFFHWFSTAIKAAVEKFGCIYVLVNNAANSVVGFFKELTQEQIE